MTPTLQQLLLPLLPLPLLLVLPLLLLLRGNDCARGRVTQLQHLSAQPLPPDAELRLAEGQGRLLQPL